MLQSAGVTLDFAMKSVAMGVGRDKRILRLICDLEQNLFQSPCDFEAMLDRDAGSFVGANLVATGRGGARGDVKS